MKRILASLLMMVALAACASPLAKAETPQQALSGAAQRSSQLHSAKFDLQGNVTMTFPPEMAQKLGQNGGARSFSLDMTRTGEAQFPDRYHATINAQLAGISDADQGIVAQGKTFLKKPVRRPVKDFAQAGLTGHLLPPD